MIFDDFTNEQLTEMVKREKLEELDREVERFDEEDC